HDEAWEILVTYRDVLDNLVLRLMDTETLSKDEVAEVFATVQKRPVRGIYTGVGRRVPSDRPPVQTPAELGLLTADVADLVNDPGHGNGAAGRGPGGNGTGGNRAGGHGQPAGVPGAPAGSGPGVDPSGPGGGVPHGTDVGGPGGNGSPGGHGYPQGQGTPAPPGGEGPAHDGPRIANPWAPPSWPSDDERRRR
ncbi:cell division protein FtsH, partial [Frankia casuarinae]